MKKSFAVALLALSMVLLIAFVGCSNNNQGSSSTSASSASSSASGNFELKLGFDPEYPPYGFLDNTGKYTGFDLDFAEAVCKLKGWTLKTVPIDWAAKDAMLNSGAINCIWNGFTVEGRENNYTFSKPYMLNEQVVVVKEGSSVNALNDLSGKVVITQADSAAFEVLTDGDRASLGQSFSALQTIADYNNAFRQLDSGLIDAVACDSSIAKYQIAANPSQYKVLSEPLSSEHYAVGFAKGDTSLANEIDSAFKELKDNGFVDELCDKYSTYGISKENCLL